MDAIPVRTRFAPSPTGALHLGNARTAVINWLFAHARDGVFVLRSEDTDAARTEADALPGQVADLRWLGLHWDEGPDVGGDHAPYSQIERLSLYRSYHDRLLEADLAYPCFCTREELAASRDRQVAARQAPRYAGTCAYLTEVERQQRRAEGRSESIRFRVPEQGDVTFDDLVHGRQRFRTRDIGDFVIARTDGTPSFFFANAVDDSLMGITHVLRGEDHLANTPRQLLLLEALSLKAPVYGHFGLITGADGQPLSKRGAAASIGALCSAGYRPEAIVNHLARVGIGGMPEGLCTTDALASAFDLERVTRGSAGHDPRMLDGWQRQALDAMSAAELWRWMQEAGGDNLPKLTPEQGAAMADAIRPNIHLRDEACGWLRWLLDPGMKPDSEARTIIADAGADFFRTALTVGEPSPAEGFRDWARAVGDATGKRGKQLFQPLRAALTGRLEGPELAAVVPLLPADLLTARLRQAADMAA